MDVRKIRNIGLFGTLLNTGMLCYFMVQIVYTIALIHATQSALDGRSGNLSEIDPESIVAGYQVLGEFFGTGFLIFGVLLAYVLLLVQAFLTVLLFVTVIMGIVTYVRSTGITTEERLRRMFRRDGMVRMIINVILAVLFMTILRGGEGTLVQTVVLVSAFAFVSVMGFLEYHQSGMEHSVEHTI